MQLSEIIQLSEELLLCVRQAGKLISEIYFSKDQGFKEKQDGTPLTKADLVAHLFIEKNLLSLAPEIPILSEEGLIHTKKEQKLFWLVDPLDGTKEFINRNGEFTVNIALISNFRPILGVVHLPVLDKSYIGIPEHGSFKISGNKEKKKIKTSKINQSLCRITHSRSHLEEKDLLFIKETKEHFKEIKIIPAGSSLKLCMIAEGKADIYCRFGPTSQWDIAAGHALVEGSGGTLIDTSENKLNYLFNSLRKNPNFCCLGDINFPWQNIISRVS